MSLYVSGQARHSECILSFSVCNGVNLGDVTDEHSGWEIFFGRSDLTGLELGLGKNIYSASRVGALVYNGYQPHREIFYRPHQRAEALVIRSEFLNDFFGPEFATSSVDFQSLVSPDSDFLHNARQTFVALRASVVDKENARALTESLAIDWVEKHSISHRARLGKIEFGAGRLLLKEILSEIHRRLFDDELDLESIAGDLGISRFHLVRTMKKLVGLTPYAYVRRLRLQAGRKLLCESPWSVTRIALECGFAETSAFHKAFRSWQGISPADFRKAHKLSTNKLT